MAPPPCRRRRSTLPALMEELVEEVLIRISPDDPAHVFRAALVCKRWRRILSDPGFLRRYRAFHKRRPPLLGFFYNEWSHTGCTARFKPASAAIPQLPTHYGHCARCVLDCRHGRVLHRDLLNKNLLIVWDPISDAWQELKVHNIVWECESYCFVVLCATAGCDHDDCRGGPFLVVYLGLDKARDDGTIFRVLVYSSEACAWGAPVTSKLDGLWDLGVYCGRATVIGDKIYCAFTPGVNIVQYDLVKSCISFSSSSSISSEASHNPPPNVGQSFALTQNEDGLLGLASIRGSRLYLWSSRMLNHDGELVAKWVQKRAIKLDKIVPIDTNKHRAQIYVSGFAEGVGILLICTNVGTFTLELKSWRVRQITASYYFTAFPFISFFTPSEATGRPATSAKPTLKKFYVDSP